MTAPKPSGPLVAEWVDFFREPQRQPNPAYPAGIDVDATGGKTPCCTIDLRHPAPRCGAWLIKCTLCGLTAMATTAGRADDPRSLTVACKIRRGTQ
jgi:hypothetical protein